MVILIPGGHSLQYAHCLFLCGFLHIYRLESSFQGGILLNIFTVFRNCCGADQLDFPSGKGWLQNIGGVNRPLRAACADQGVQLIQEQQDVPILRHLFDYLLNTLLKFASVLASGNHA